MSVLPSYKQSIKGFVPPPTYQDVINHTPEINLLPNQFAHPDYYTVDQLELFDADELVDIYDDDVVEYFEAGLHDKELYEPSTAQELDDLETSMELFMREKLVQIQRNTSFVNKRVISRDLGYFIDQLRDSTVQDFERIECKVTMQLSLLPQLIEDYKKYNQNYISTEKTISGLQQQLNTFYQHGACPSTHKPLIQEVTHKLYQAHNRLNKCYWNLFLIKKQVHKFVNDDDVSYVLKERARVYNDAKQVVLNRQRIH